MGLKARGVFHCGHCRKRYTNPFTHTCVVDNSKRKSRARTKIGSPVTWECGICHKPRGLNHTCHVRTDFKKRKRAAARKAATDKRRRRRQEVRARQAARRKAAAAERRARARARKQLARKASPRPARPRGDGHEPGTCGDPECPKYACRAYWEGYEVGSGAGFDSGYAAAQADGGE